MKWLNRQIRRTRIYREIEHKLYTETAHRLRLEGELAELSERIASVSEKLCRVSIQRHDDMARRRLRICLELDASIIETGFLHGNDNSLIAAIGRDIGARAAHEIRKANFQRWEY